MPNDYRSKQMMAWLVALGLVVACTARQAHTVGHYPDTSSPCERQSPFKAPELHRARVRDSGLVDRGQWGLAFVIDSGATDHGLADVFVLLPRYKVYARTDTAGRAMLSRTGKDSIDVTVKRLAYFTWNGVATVRTGYRDTLRLRLAARLLCDM
jgi:hypothetical protein